jgi:hypothetical protein
MVLFSITAQRHNVRHIRGERMAPAGQERLDDVVREYIAFVNEQVGTYMDALAGFAGHYARVERQVHRISRPSKAKKKEKGDPVVVWASYEDPSKPDIIHNRIIRADDYLAANARGGSNEQKHARAIVIVLFTYWEDEIRPRLARAKGVPIQENSLGHHGRSTNPEKCDPPFQEHPPLRQAEGASEAGRHVRGRPTASPVL